MTSWRTSHLVPANVYRRDNVQKESEGREKNLSPLEGDGTQRKSLRLFHGTRFVVVVGGWVGGCLRSGAGTPARGANIAEVTAVPRSLVSVDGPGGERFSTVTAHAIYAPLLRHIQHVARVHAAHNTARGQTCGRLRAHKLFSRRRVAFFVFLRSSHHATFAR